MSGCLRKQVVYFDSFHGLRSVDFDPVWFLFLKHKVLRSANVAVVYKNIKQRQQGIIIYRPVESDYRRNRRNGDQEALTPGGTESCKS